MRQGPNVSSNTSSNGSSEAAKRQELRKTVSRKPTIPLEFLQFRPGKYKLEFGPPFKCDICAKNFDTIGTIRRHMVVHFTKNLRKNYSTCKICLLPFQDIRSHIKAVHLNKQKNQIDKYPCDPCSLTFDTKQEYNTHIGHHRPYVCTACSQSFNKKQTLDLHFAAIHVQENRFKCNLCPEKSFSTNYRLKCHYIVIQPKNHLNAINVRWRTR